MHFDIHLATDAVVGDGDGDARRRAPPAADVGGLLTASATGPPCDSSIVEVLR